MEVGADAMTLFWCRGSTFHKWATIAWATGGAFCTYIWADSVPWVNLMSLYAIVVSHATGYHAARAAEENENQGKKKK